MTRRPRFDAAILVLAIVGALVAPPVATANLAPASGSVAVTWTYREGIATTYGPGWSPRLNALPHGPGWRFRVCGKRCMTLVSTDAGPDRAAQRRGRIVDLALKNWLYVCRLPYSRGVCPVTVRILGRVS